MMDTLLLLDRVEKFYPPNRRAISIARLAMQKGEFTAMLGGPGSGKTTLLRLICGMQDPSSGSVIVMGRDLAAMGDKQRAEFRNRHLGVILRKSVFLEGLSAAQNAALPLIAGGEDVNTATRQAKDLLKSFGLERRTDSLTGALTGTERCLVQLARAAIRRPEILLLDEPGGDLGQKEKERLLENLQVITQAAGCTVLCFTADRHLADRFSRVALLRDGEIVKE